MIAALITEVFPGEDAEQRLATRLVEARREGATLALLPELPLQSWCPLSKTPRDEDAEPPGGRRHAVQARAAARAGIGLVGGAIVRAPESGARCNVALVLAADGRLIETYAKLHLPDEEGFWEAHHYEPGEAPPRAIDAFDLSLGIQICSDINRPSGAQILAAQGAEMIFVPRATPAESYERWKLVLRAAAVTSAAYIVSVNRPEGEPGVNVAGPSLAIDPYGQVLIETTEPVRGVSLQRAVTQAARRDYPGYLALRSGLYGRAWRDLEGEQKA